MLLYYNKMQKISVKWYAWRLGWAHAEGSPKTTGGACCYFFLLFVPLSSASLWRAQSNRAFAALCLPG